MADDDIQFERMTLGEHLDELRKRLVYALLGLVAAMTGTLVFGRDLLGMLEYSYRRAMADAGLQTQLYFPSYTAPLTTYLSVSLVFGLVIASPWILWQLWQFVAAGLYPRERRYVTGMAPFSILLFVAGAGFFLFYVSRQVIAFFIGINKWLGYEPVIMLQDHISFMLRLILVFGVAFQTPLAVFLLARVGLVSVATLNKTRRHVIVGILILAAIFTPPDPFSQIVLAIPMWALYELGVLLAFLAGRKRTPAETESP